MEEEKNNQNLNNSTDFQDISSMPQAKLLELAEERFEKCQLEDAAQFYEEAIKQNPDNDDVLLSYGEFLKQCDEIEKSEFVFIRSIELNPEKNIKKYFQLAELKTGKDALDLYEKGVGLLEKNLQNLQKDEIKDLCNAYAAIAELYQTDFVQFKESEKCCTDNIEKALKLDPENLDAKLQLANYFLNKEDSEKAKEALLHIFQNLNLDQDSNIDFICQQQGGNQQQQQEQQQKLYEAQKQQQNITQSFKTNVAKLLMEVECYGQSQQVLEHLTFLDSDNKEHLYLLAFVNFKQGNFYHALEQVEELLGKRFSAEDDDMDEEIQIAAQELKSELDKTDFKLAKDYVENEQDAQQLQQIKELLTGSENQQDEWVDMEEED